MRIFRDDNFTDIALEKRDKEKEKRKSFLKRSDK
tara:strand:+ start:522 stop:623 length:102 start_codon:yes stop_codon:yes gene_type:complete